MQVTSYSVNSIGLKEISAFLAKKHKKGSAANEHIYASTVEFQLGNGNPPCFEISQSDSISGNREVYMISDAGLDAETINIAEVVSESWAVG